MTITVKVWTDPETSERYLVAMALYSDLSDRLVALVLSDKGSRNINMPVDEYNALPYHVFADQGPAAGAKKSMTGRLLVEEMIDDPHR